MSAANTPQPNPGAGLCWERLNSIQESATVGQLCRILITGSREGMISVGIGAHLMSAETWPQVFGLATRKEARTEGAKLAARLVLDALRELGGEAVEAALLDLASMSDFELRQLRHAAEEEERRRRAARHAAHERASSGQAQEVKRVE